VIYSPPRSATTTKLCGTTRPDGSLPGIIPTGGWITLEIAIPDNICAFYGETQLKAGRNVFYG
jgi:hypothetical protein